MAALGGEALTANLGDLAAGITVEHLYDQFLDLEGRFRFDPTGVVQGGLPLDIALAELLMEGMRLLDEWPRIEAQFPSEGGRLELAGAVHPAPTVLQRTLLECAGRGLTLSETRWALGLSRPAVLRRVYELVAAGCLAVKGAQAQEDLSVKLISQARALLKQQQFDEAAHVFSALLASDPSAASVRNLLASAERQQLEWLRSEVPSQAVPLRIRPDADISLLTHADREVLARVNGRWDVGVVALLSPLRETETLKSLRKLRKLRLVELR
jgi:DNA-binding Lrp family transcriptional regulator